jgi:CheY-like chemotaxis protein
MKILVAEDDDINRSLISEILSDEGYNVISVCDGEEMIKTALSDKPDLIITDIQMPNMSGDTIIAMIEEYNDLADIPIIVMTGMSENDFKKLGVSIDRKVMFKPINIEELKKLVVTYKK